MTTTGAAPEAGPRAGTITAMAGGGQTRAPLVVAAAIVDDLSYPTMLLSARRSAPKSLAGRWEFPGGKVEPGESHRAALEREVLEELGVTVEIGRRVNGPVDGGWRVLRGYTMRIWLARVSHGSPEPLIDHDELRWLPRGQWYDVPWLDLDVPIIDAVMRLPRVP